MRRRMTPNRCSWATSASWGRYVFTFPNLEGGIRGAAEVLSVSPALNTKSESTPGHRRRRNVLSARVEIRGQTVPLRPGDQARVRRAPLQIRRFNQLR